MRKSVLVVLALLLSPLVFPWLSVSASVQIPTTTKLGFGNGCYLGFAETMNFTVAYQEDSSNATYPDFWFLGNATVYGFHLTNCNATVDEFFNGEVLNMTLTQTSAATASVKVYTASADEPNSILSATTKAYNSTSGVSTVTVANPVSTVVTWLWGDYSVLITPTVLAPLTGVLVTFNVVVTRGTGEAANYELNVTKDGSVFSQNLTAAFFTDTEANIQSHIYSASELYDSDAAEAVNFTVSPITVSWMGTESGPGPIPTSTPTPSVGNGTQTVVNGTEAGFSLPFSAQDAVICGGIVLGSVLVVLVVDDNKKKKRPSLKRNGSFGGVKRKRGSYL